METLLTSYPYRRVPGKKRKFDLDKSLKTIKLVAFDVGMTIVFLVTLYRIVVHELGR